ncbi:Transcription initiation factor TFIID subunit 13 [Chytridiales sp. JEL 0842]|nr:Transcription initiation factor TFIID subunit 13 [Chytridiales sp. JEL 0842]
MKERSKKRIFAKEIRQLMYGYGDVPNPAEDTCDVMEDLLMIYINDLCSKITTVTGGRRTKVSDVLYVLRSDPKKLVRVKQLLAADKDLTKAKAIMNLDELPLKKREQQVAQEEEKEEEKAQAPKRLFQFGDDAGVGEDDVEDDYEM